MPAPARVLFREDNNFSFYGFFPARREIKGFAAAKISIPGVWAGLRVFFVRAFEARARGFNYRRGLDLVGLGCFFFFIPRR